MSKEAMRQESERLVREAMARNVTITQGKTRLDVKCTKCGAPNRFSAEVDQGRVEYACKECGHKQKTCDQKTGGSLVTVGRDNIGREDVARPICTEAACGRRS
jgi:DNA-directed RNA polymerase subunit RPC12/RpoP